MKILITTTFLFFIVFLTKAADTNDQMRNQATDVARRMANQIELNESAYIQVRTFTYERLQEEAKIKDLYSYDLEMMQVKLAELDDAYAHRIQNILSNKQFENYLALQKSFKSDFHTIAISK